MNKISTLKRRGEYLIVYEQGKGWHDKLVTIKILANSLEVSRFGFSVGKEVGKAVARNLVRRRLCNIARKAKISPGWDIVFIAHREAEKTNYYQLKRTVENLLVRAKLKNRYETVGLRTN